MSGAVVRWDLWCRVVDNFGDIGVAWRLAKQLARDHRRSVRLIVDDLRTFARIEARVDPLRAMQTLDAITIVHWRDPGPDLVDLPDVVVELFGCGLPASLLDAMAAARRAHRPVPLWVDLEYLSAEPWVDDFHAKLSPHPTLPLVKHFFYPGFTHRTGGVLVEPDVVDARDAFVADRAGCGEYWTRLQVPAPVGGEKRLSIFAYPGDALERLIAAIATHTPRWSIVIPDATLSAARTAGNVHRIPFGSQDDYDRLLWACDANIVRGEDSFVRGQLAARPFVWHIYPQADHAHAVKLDAFAERYAEGLDGALADTNRAMWHAWNRDAPDLADAWIAWQDAAPELAAHAAVWRRSLIERPSLVDSVAAWVAEHRRPLLK